MAFPTGSRKQGFISAPRAFAAAGPPGQVAAITVSTTAALISLGSGISQAPFNRQNGDDPTQVVRNYVTIECDVDLAVIFAPTAAAVQTTGVPAIATVGTVDANGVYSPVIKTSWVIYSKQPTRILLQQGVDMFMGFVATGAGTMRLYQSSSDDA